MPRKGFSSHRDFASHMLGSVGEWDEATASSLYLAAPEYWQLRAVPLKKRGAVFTHAVAFRSSDPEAGKPLVLVECKEGESVLFWLCQEGVNDEGHEAMATRGKAMSPNEIVAEGWTVD